MRSPNDASSRTVSGRSKTIPRSSGRRCEQRAQQRAVAAADVDDGLVAAPVERGEPLAGRSFPPRHRAVEDRPLVGVRREPRPEVGAERRGGRSTVAGRRIERRRPRVRNTPPNRCANSCQPSVAAQQLRRLGVAEDARLVLREDAVARERAQDPVQRVGVGARPPREVRDRPRPVGERVRDAEVGGDRRAPSSSSAPRRRSQRLLGGCDVAHPRAAAPPRRPRRPPRR